MRELGQLLSGGEANEAAQRFAERVPSFNDVCGLGALGDLPVLLWEQGEVPDLSRIGLHLVEGDLKVRGEILRDLGSEQCVLVAGDLECKELHTAGWFFISGHLEAELLMGESGCNKALCAGSAEVGALLELGHSIMIERELRFEVIYSAHGMVTSEGEATAYPEQWPNEVFVDELIVGEEVDWEAFATWVAAGRRWYR
jgi:hypothetical protein